MLSILLQIIMTAQISHIQSALHLAVGNFTYDGVQLAVVLRADAFPNEPIPTLCSIYNLSAIAVRYESASETRDFELEVTKEGGKSVERTVGGRGVDRDRPVGFSPGVHPAPPHA